MPLLIDTFIEVAPNKRDNKNSSEISLQTASILKCILNIILLLWKIFQNADNPSEMVCINFFCYEIKSQFYINLWHFGILLLILLI